MIIWVGVVGSELSRSTNQREGKMGLETFYWGCGLWSVVCCAVRAVVPSYFFLYQVGASESDVAYEWVKRCRFSLYSDIFQPKFFFPPLNK